MIRYSNDTRNDLREILGYTVDRWGEAQADRYLNLLTECFEQVEKLQTLGRVCPGIYQELYRIERGQHVIFYLREPNSVFICRVLHQRMLAHYEDFLASFAESIE